MPPIDLGALPPRYQRQALDKLRQKAGQLPQERRSKYGAQEASRGKLRFDSQKEARRFDELCLEQAAGIAEKPEASEMTLADGTYQAAASEASNGYTDQVTITVADGKITEVNWEAVAEDGSLKSVMSENGEYVGGWSDLGRTVKGSGRSPD